ncbi:hypothetical protein [Streptosporangium sp. NPDC051022]|uniref:hypothetical protein n=1 Tax=Streptosporangium sp. NPDC051022 TaxID=3155752 RepID=UPI0034140933
MELDPYGPGWQAGYYRYLDGEFVVTTAGTAALLGATVEQVRAQARGRTEPPADWTRNIRRVHREAAARLGYMPNQKELFDWLAEQAAE